MTLQVYDTLAGRKRAFEPLNPNRVGIYLCGPTVYDYPHLGHARSCVVFDTVVRYLRTLFPVTYVRNYTDVDDKIIKRAGELSEPPSELSQRFIDAYEADMGALGCRDPDATPRVTQHMPEIVTMIAALVHKGVAYASAGDVYYSVESFADYGKLGKRSLEDMEAGARVEVSEAKRHPMDFALWKAAKPGEPAWDSPWGKGRPGWHIECSVMSGELLGHTFDIHGGGKDLVFPHHENEIAQSEAANDAPFARYWMHNGFVNIDDEKMSKSLGNFFTVRDILEQFEPQTVRHYLLTTHYRSPINFSDQALRESEARVKYIYETIARINTTLEKLGPGDDGHKAGPYRFDGVSELGASFHAAMQDDFNSCEAIAGLSDAFKWANDIVERPGTADEDRRTLGRIRYELAAIADVLGVFGETPADVLMQIETRRHGRGGGVDAAQVEALIAERREARSAKNFARADEIRQELTDMGVAIKDAAGETTWEVVA